MDKLPEFVSMAMEPKEGDMLPENMQPMYPYGLCIRLTSEELQKLDLEDNCNVGDMLHMHALCEVTSVSKNQTQDGTKCCVELQITHIACESEDEENEEAEESMPHKVDYKKFYPEK